VDLRFSAEDDAYRARLRQWIQDHAAIAGAIGKATDPVQAARDWARRVWQAGYAGLGWPTAFGGHAATLTQQIVVNEQFARAGLPPLINVIGLSIFAPTLILHGTEAQKRRFLPKILSAEELWCQGFSEPGAGSDLPSLRTSARLDGEHFLVNGQKVWTSLAMVSDWCFLLARTDRDAPKREGISYLLCDMTTPGITVRPLRNAGGGEHFCEVYFQDVRIPRENLVGALHGGWKIARSSLDHERSGLAGVVALEGHLARLVKLAATTRRAGGTAIEDAVTRQQLARFWIELEGLRYLGFRAFSDQLAGREPGPSGAVGKLFASRLRQSMARATFDLAGPLAPLTKKSPHVLQKGRVVAGYFDALGYSIGGGTSEIMRNTIAEKVLGLPRTVGDDG
jgi:alkylation response protein AidB-like acyl-CoA dehydrogenase